MIKIKMLFKIKQKPRKVPSPIYWIPNQIKMANTIEKILFKVKLFLLIKAIGLVSFNLLNNFKQILNVKTEIKSKNRQPFKSDFKSYNFYFHRLLSSALSILLR